jgi:glucosamine-phosphate N-acetyltransferase
MRLIDKSDYYKGYMNLINIFTRHPENITYENFCIALSTIQNNGSEIYVIEKDDKIVASLTILFEQKIHNNLRLVGHIEDVCVLPEYRGKGYAKELINYAINICKIKYCYKTLLSCNDEYIEFYKAFGFIRKGNELTIYN